LRNFIGHFWAPFGRFAAQKLAEDKRAKVLTVFVVALFLLFFVAFGPDILAYHYTTAQIQRRSVGRYKPFQHLTVGRYKLITTHI